MVADMFNNKNVNLVVTELFIWGRKLNTSLVVITQSYLAVPKNIKLNSAHNFIVKFSNKEELQQIATNNWSNIIWIFTKNVLQNHILC